MEKDIIRGGRGSQRNGEMEITRGNRIALEARFCEAGLFYFVETITLHTAARTKKEAIRRNPYREKSVTVSRRSANEKWRQRWIIFSCGGGYICGLDTDGGYATWLSPTY